MRVVIDSNVLARATPGKSSASREVLLLLTSAPHTLITAIALLTELARILQYPRLRALHGLDDAGIQGFLHSVQTGALIVAPASPAPIQTQDPDDDLVIATAVAGQGDAICTRDRHLFHPSIKAGCAAYGLRIVNEVDLLRELCALALPQPGTP